MIPEIHLNAILKVLMQKVMSKNEGLFACSKCHGRFAFEELSRSEHLCKVSPVFPYFLYKDFSNV